MTLHKKYNNGFMMMYHCHDILCAWNAINQFMQSKITKQSDIHFIGFKSESYKNLLFENGIDEWRTEL
jgi:hypothetical protein